MEDFDISRFRGALIDMDGVLYDSMPRHARAWKVMTDICGLNCDPDEFYLYEGMTGPATIQLIYRRERHYDIEHEDAEILYAIKSRHFAAMGSAPTMPGADRMLRAFEQAGIPRVLVTGSGQKSLLDKLDRDYPGAFADNHRVTALDVTHGKPDPEPYLRGAAKLGFDPQDCIVVENAPLGVRAGKAAGCFTVAVMTGPIPRERFVEEHADMIFDTMPQFAAWLEQKLAKVD